MSNLTAARLREVVHYNPETGKFTWLVRQRSDFATSQGYGAWKATCLGKEPGVVRSDGYRRICIDSHSHWAHRLAWLYIYGEWPAGAIDHINGEPSDNRIENLRDIPRGENQKNMRRSVANTSGHTGVYLTRYGTWMAAIGNDGHKICLGSFQRKDEALAARREAEARLGYHPNHGRAE